MTIELILLIGIILLCIASIIFSYKASSSTDARQILELNYKLDSITKDISRIEFSVKDEIVNNRKETLLEIKSSREELSNSLKSFGDLVSNSMKTIGDVQKDQLGSFSKNLNDLTKSIEEKLSGLTSSMETKLKELNEGNITSAKENRNELRTTLDIMRNTIEKKIFDMQQGNEKKLDQMRETVDEKLQKTLETRLGESFKLVSESLESVHKGLGDMQQLVTGVGDLKKVLSNVKTRGVMGEYQLANLLEQILTPDQYATNQRTKIGSNASVEFAVKLPSGDNKEDILWLPIDSKFPKEDFELLVDAYEHGNSEQIDELRKNFVRGIKKCAQDICGKYIDPPNTTDFAILFLPFESLYAEVLRTPGLFESIKKDWNIVILGPTTLAAFLSSLQMGFRTLAIQKRSSEVWNLLAAVKTEFGSFGEVLDATKRKLDQASRDIDKAGVRSRAIERKLRDVQELPKNNVPELIENLQNIIDDDTEEPVDDTEEPIDI
jgi:DNA recombination protein RmuC